ncbi:MAG: DUF1735 and LamG domain-containing protein [Clostridium sp.]|nr:DUF1735 and LamG domain-containing protein [Bacteroides sp.]MCM1197298.1 DUF1735 and LamG domain-containing protein [Clostridium sp.]
MKSYNKIIFCALAALSLLSCDKQKDGFENKVFIDAVNFKNEVRVATDEGISSLVRSFTVATAQPLSYDLHVSVNRAPELLETYRSAYYAPEAQLLPEANCDMDGLTAIIRSGDVKSSNIDLTFTGLDKLDYSKDYVLPVTISSDGLDVLQRARTMYFVVKEASLVNYVADMAGNCAWPIWDDFDRVKNLETFTFETLVNCHAFNNESKIHTIMGVEDHFLVRIGDVTIPTNQIQVACAVVDVEGGSTYRNSVSDAALQLRADRWYHLAVTFDKGVVSVYLDGRLRASDDLSHIANRPNSETGQLDPVYFKSVDFSAPHSDEMDNKPRCFWLGYSYDDKRSLDGMMAEVRIWNRVLSAEEINKPNHFYKLYEDEIDDSLIAYWKFCEGTGKTVKDYSSSAKDLTADHDFVWYPVELPEKN